MSDFVNTVDIVGDEALTASILDGSVTEFHSDEITSLGIYALYNCSALTSADCPAVTIIGTNAIRGTGLAYVSFSALQDIPESMLNGVGSLKNAYFAAAKTIGKDAFRRCSALETIYAPEVTTIGADAFSSCSALQELVFLNALSMGTYAFSGCNSAMRIVLPKLTSVPAGAFDYCTKATSVDLPSAETIEQNAFRSCAALTMLDLPKATNIVYSAFLSASKLGTLILRNTEAICSLGGTNAFSGTPISSTKGYIYVPRVFLSDTDETLDYRRATNWSSFATQFRALEDYTVDGTTTGALDPTKI